MAPRRRTQHELRCDCKVTPILGMYGIDEEGRVYFHVKSWKQQKLITELVVLAPSTIKIHCRMCFRWHNVLMRAPKVELQETKEPGYLPRSTPSASRG